MWVLAHRGASKAAPENTLKAFRLAIEKGATGIEFDTYQLGEQIVVFHDRWLDRTTNGHGLITAQSFEALRQLDAGDGEVIPTLAETLALMPANALCNIEIKHLTDAAGWLKTLDLAMAASSLDYSKLILSSFNHTWLRQLKNLRPELQVGALTATYPENGAEFATHLSAYSLHMDLDVIDQHYVTQAQQAGLKVLVYTVDQKEDLLLMADWGVDGVFTNVPELAKQVLAERVESALAPGTEEK
ncbi:glycerophosphodiester phosphodiesterase [Alteromonas aestuariivivens]|uniref:Glycerophosphodiester phosphodiesterase n=1 Tax=Alteromonas aestuariivivens TaxID=1938339 RepID=A0A3D8MB09_9ALTE|nr:glycerophosphodiester phosphodiesterase family protein [Alteromonas aestuariivivens]RDV26672.1 glycerophosphodiester phosphodiesterase [Alteromonas aestuariivivens]